MKEHKELADVGQKFNHRQILVQEYTGSPKSLWLTQGHSHSSSQSAVLLSSDFSPVSHCFPIKLWNRLASASIIQCLAWVMHPIALPHVIIFNLISKHPGRSGSVAVM